LTWPLLPFLLLGLAVRGRALWRTRGDLYLLSFFALYGVTLYRLAVTGGDASKRHLLPLVLLALGWVGLGVVSLGVRLEGALKVRGVRWASRAGAILILGLVCVALPRDLEINANERTGGKLAGLWISDHWNEEQKPLIFAPRERIAYYANARFLPIPLRFQYDAAIAYLRGYGADFVVTNEQMSERWYPGFLEGIRPGDLGLEASFPERPGVEKRYRVYRVLYPDGRPENPPKYPRSMWRGGAP
jgi:hypothetical protein